MVEVVLLDIEGTTTPIRFVHDVLFPYARAHLPALLRDRGEEPAVAAEVAAVRESVPGADPLATLLGWMDSDMKATPLKALQGMVWDAGYADGSLLGMLYPDVGPALRRWRAAGLRLAVYSSGSIKAQRLIYQNSTAGDLSALFDRYFDTTTGPKRAAASYSDIVAALAAQPGDVLFLSDVGEELDAAAAAGLLTCQVLRAEDGTVSVGRHGTAVDFEAVEERFRLLSRRR